MAHKKQCAQRCGSDRFIHAEQVERRRAKLKMKQHSEREETIHTNVPRFLGHSTYAVCERGRGIALVVRKKRGEEIG
jgi:hypothetical protein